MTQLDLADNTTDAALVAANRPTSGLVFLGVQVSWERRIADLQLNTQIAEGWESAFGHWSIEERNVHLSHVALGYGVYMNDGAVQFTVQLPNLTMPLVRQHVSDLLAALFATQRKSIRITSEAQYLEPVDVDGFGTLLTDLRHKLLNDAFVDSVGGVVTDFSYLVDMEREGQWFQVSIGPVRAYEVPQRVASLKLKAIPEYARFYSVTSRVAIDVPEFDMDAYFGRLFRMGESVATELRR